MATIDQANYGAMPAKIATPRRLYISNLLALAFVTALISPFVSYVGHGLRMAWPVFMLWLIFAFAEDKSLTQGIKPELKARRRELLAFVFLLLLILANTLLGRGYSGISHLLNMMTVGMLLFMDVVYTARGAERRSTLVILVILWIGAESVRAIPSLWATPFLPRLAMAEYGSSIVYRSVFLASVGEYSTYTAFALALPFMLAVALDKRGWLRILLLLACGATALAVALATFMGAILLMLTGMLLFLVLYIRQARRKIGAILFGMVFCAGALFTWFAVLSSSSQGQVILEKLLGQVSNVAAVGVLEGDQTFRSDLWILSLETFLANPIFGIGPSSGTENPNVGFLVGVHSSWLDLPAEYGVVGIGLYLLFVFGIMRRTAFSTHEKRNPVAQARIVACLLFLLAGAYNPVVFIQQIDLVMFLLVLGGVPSSTSAAQRAPFAGGGSL